MIITSKVFTFFDKFISRRILLCSILLVFSFFFGFFCHKILANSQYFSLRTTSLNYNNNTANLQNAKKYSDFDTKNPEIDRNKDIIIVKFNKIL